MSDPTQTLSVELTEDEVNALHCAEGGPGFSNAVRDHRHAVLAKLRKAALSQPEHQGDEGLVQKLMELAREKGDKADEGGFPGRIEALRSAQEAYETAARLVAEVQSPGGVGEYVEDCPDCNPASTQVEGELSIHCKGDLHAQCAGQADPAEQCGCRCHSGGEEKWPEVVLSDTETARLAGLTSAPREPTGKTRRYVPATSQGCSGRHCLDADCRICEAEGERSSLFGELARLLGPRTPRPGTTANDHWISAVAAVLARAERAEAALEGLAAEFEQGGDAERDADEPGVPSSVYYDCAAKAREKAAKLKGGGS